MALRALLRWLVFAIYVSLFFLFPLGVLGEGAGLILGLILTLSFLVLMGWRGRTRIAVRLKAVPLTAAQAPHAHAAVQEFCRRLQMPSPELRVIESPAINLAVFGFSRNRMCLVVTRGALQMLDREALSALIGRELTYLWHGDAIGDSWLTQFLSLLDRLVSPGKSRTAHNRRSYPFRLFFRRVLIYPLTLFPAWCLRGKRDPSELDLLSVKITRKPEALAEGLRLVEALRHRFPLHTRFSTRHLFLVSPLTQDPLARVFFGQDRLGSRIQAVETLSEIVAPI